MNPVREFTASINQEFKFVEAFSPDELKRKVRWNHPYNIRFDKMSRPEDTIFFKSEDERLLLVFDSKFFLCQIFINNRIGIDSNGTESIEFNITIPKAVDQFNEFMKFFFKYDLPEYETGYITTYKKNSVYKVKMVRDFMGLGWSAINKYMKSTLISIDGIIRIYNAFPPDIIGSTFEEAKRTLIERENISFARASMTLAKIKTRIKKLEELNESN